MSWISQHGFEMIFVVAYLGILAHHAWSSRGTRFDSAKMPYWAIAISFFATFVSTNSFIGHAGKSWDIGLVWYLKLLSYVLFISLAWFVVAPRFFEKKEQYGSRTVADFLGYHYDSVLVRRVAAAIIVLASILYLVAVYKAASLGFQQFFGFDYTTSLLIIFGIVTAYTYLGGFGAVVKTDAWQGMFLAVGGIAIFIAVLVHGGGISTLLSDLRAQDPALVSWQGKMPFIEIVGLAMAGGVKMLVDPRQVSRFYGLKSQQEIWKAGIIASSLIIITYICLLPVGAFARALIPVGEITDSDEVMPYLLGQAEILGVFGSVLLLVLISAAMSTLDSVLLVVASVADQDLLIKGERLTRASLTSWKKKYTIPALMKDKVEDLLHREDLDLGQVREELDTRLGLLEPGTLDRNSSNQSWRLSPWNKWKFSKTAHNKQVERLLNFVPPNVMAKVDDLVERKYQTLKQFQKTLEERLTKNEWERYGPSFMEMINLPAVRRQRPWLIGVSLVSMLLAINPFAGIVEVTAFAGSVYAACFLPTMIGGLFWRGTARATLTCMLLGAISVTTWFFLKKIGWTGWHEVYVGIVVGTASFILISWVKARDR